MRPQFACRSASPKRDLVDAAADEEVAGERPCCRVVDHLVDLELVVACARLEEEVVGQIPDQVPGGVDVVAAPRLAHRVLNHRRGSAREELLRVAGVLDALQRIFFAGFLFAAPVSIVLIAVETSSM